jgi:hypothetical protein
MGNQDFYNKVYYNYDLQPWRASADQIYGFHLESILSKLSNLLGPLYDEFTFIVYDHKMWLPMPKFKITGKRVILIFLADENSTVPDDISDLFFAVFKAFYPLTEPKGNILPFPVGYSNSASLTSFRPFEERVYEVSFAGNFLGNRLDFYRQFTWLRFLPPFPITPPRLRTFYFKLLTKLRIFRPRKFIDTFGKSICYWSGGFAKGLSRDEYAEIISETRIALCPKGFKSTECYRLLETMRLGCVIVSDELPPSRWYKDSPIIVERDWLNIGKVIDKLRKDPATLLKLHSQTLEWWNDVCSDEAVAAYLADQIRRLLKNDHECPNTQQAQA